MRIQSEALWPSTTQKKYVNTKPGRWDRYHPGDKRLRSGSQEAWESRNRHYGERNLLPFPGPHSHQPPQGNQGTKIPNLLLWPQNRWTNLHLVSRGHKGPALLRTEKKEIRETPEQDSLLVWVQMERAAAENRSRGSALQNLLLSVAMPWENTGDKVSQKHRLQDLLS